MAALCLAGYGAHIASAQVPVVSLDDVTTPVAEAVEKMPALSATVTPDAAQVLRTEDAYVVQEGDTLWKVALEIGTDLSDMPCAIRPDFRVDQPLVIGDSISPPSTDVICHQVGPGETVASIAELYGVDPIRIYEEVWNQLIVSPQGGATLHEGRYVRVPKGEAETQGGNQSGFFAYMLTQPVAVTPYVAYAVGGPKFAPAEVSVPADWPYGSGRFYWPVYGWVTQGYRQDHRAVDIAAALGTFVTAADRGVVVRAGWNDQGYGMFVVIDHNIDYVTLYSHLQDIYVREGDVVAQGQVIGSVGSTGNSTGPHLHFEVRDFGARINPLEVLLH